jgi:type II restriction enzyme
MALKGNVGDWSEIYTLFKIISDKNLFVGDENLKKINGLVYPLIKVLREENSTKYEYTLHSDIVIVAADGNELTRVSVDEFTEYAKLTLASLKDTSKRSKGAFPLPHIESFMRSVHCTSLKAPSSAKTDIILVIHDIKTNQTPYLGFSIKSQLGGASTLLNAGKTTNFQYSLNGMTDSLMESINKIDSRHKLKERLKVIYDATISLNFIKVNHSTFANNLILIDSRLNEILGELLVLNYLSNESRLSALVEQLEEQNPLDFARVENQKFYAYKIKRFLSDVAVGMMPSKVWNGNYDATGGYLIVKDSGEVLCYHLYNKNEFENYLFRNTKFETGSTTRHDFGLIYKVGDEFFINLNLQIRFIN